MFQDPSTTAAKSQSSQNGEGKDEPAASPGTSGPALAGSVATGDATTGDGLTTHTTPSDSPRLSDAEARLYYHGLGARLVARTGSTPWEEPTGPEGSWREKELGLASSHRISKIWRDVVAPQVLAILKEAQVHWTSLNVVRIGYDDEYIKPVVLWIGIDPDSKVPYKVNYDTAVKCKQVLVDNDIEDVEVEMNESRVVRF